MTRFDVSEIEGTRCYCSAEAAEQIRKKIRRISLCGEHYWGSGDYHYITLFQLERICEPFTLILFDNHTDRQQSAFGTDILSCGNWVLSAEKLPMLKNTVHIAGTGWNESATNDLPLYISIDLDVLSTKYATTNWDQGTMSLEELCHIVTLLAKGHRIIGIDFCGAPQGDVPCSLNELAINQISKAAL